MQAIYERQDLTPADVERLRAARQELQRQEEMLEREVEAIDSDIWKEEMSIAKLLEQVRMPSGLLAGWWLGERQVGGYKDSSSPVTLKCAQEFVLVTFCSYSSLTQA